MVYRNSWLAGLVALLFAFVQLDNLILPTRDGVLWQYMVVAALALGIIISWTALTYRLKTWLVVVINAAAAFIAITRVATPDTTAFYLPTRASLVNLNNQLRAAQHLIRTGVEPVAPDAGVIIVVMLVFWAVGGLLSWGLIRGHPYVALLPPLVLSLQFATMDRRPTSAAAMAAFIALVALVIFAITSDDRDHTSGRMAPHGQWASDKNRPGPAAAALLSVTVLGSVFVVSAFDGAVPHDGVLKWRVSSGLPSDAYGGSVSYNAFVDIKQRLVTGSQTPVFLATIASDVPAEEVYFRFMTLESYDGSKFSVAASDLLDVDDAVWENPGHQFAGPTAPLAVGITIDQLNMAWLPTPSVPFAVQGISEEIEPYLGIRAADGAVYYPNRTSREMQYRVDANMPRPDINVLATDQTTGNLSIAFRAALADPDVPFANVPEPATVEFIRPDPANSAIFLELPTDPGARITQIRALARQQTEGLETKFEKGLALETYLRTFDYTTDITPGQGAEDLAAWLLDPDSPNYHSGYCENFSTAMAIMARTIGIHSRVVLGFTPGERSVLQNDVIVVRDRNAHAWVELWMPSQGWVRFDPTPRGDAINPSTGGLIEEDLDLAISAYLDIELPDQAGAGGGGLSLLEDEFPEIFTGSGGGAVDEPTATGRTIPVWLRWAAPIFGLILLLVIAVPAIRRWRHRHRIRRLRSGDISAAWKDIVIRLDDLGSPVRPTSTPVEVTMEVADEMVPLAAIYARTIYGPSNGGATREEISEAEASLMATRVRVTSRARRRKRLASRYRPLIPRRRRSRR